MTVAQRRWRQLVRLGLSLGICVWLVALSLPVSAATGAPPDGAAAYGTEPAGVITDGALPIGPGTSLQLRHDNLKGLPQRIGVVTIDPDNPLIRLQTAGAAHVGLRERVSLQARRDAGPQQTVIAAVNGDFFDNSIGSGGVPTGLFVVDGELLVNPWGPALGILAGNRPIIGTPAWQARVEIIDPEGRVIAQRALDAVNRRRDENRLVLYTPAFGNSTLTNNWGVEVTVAGLPAPLTPAYDGMGIVRSIAVGNGLGIGSPEPAAPGDDNPNPDADADSATNPVGLPPDSEGLRLGLGSAEIRPGSMVISGHGDAGRFLLQHALAGRTVRLIIEADEPWDKVRFALGGRPLLVAEGQLQKVGAGDPLPNSRAPRTAAGLDSAGRLVLVTVDGRQHDSAGFTLGEFADYLAAMGLRTALNLDGGGSTVLYARRAGHLTGAVVNSPSDGGERAVANSLQVVSTAPAGATVTRLWVEPGGAQLMLPGSTLDLTVRAQDEYFGPIDTGLEPVDWLAAGEQNVAAVNDANRLTALNPGTMTAIAQVGGQAAPVTVTVLSPRQVGVVELVPAPAAGWQQGKAVALGVRVTDQQGRPVRTEGVKLTWEASAGLGTIVDGQLVLANELPLGELVVRLQYPGDEAEAAVLARWLLGVDEDGLWTVQRAPQFDDAVDHWARGAITELVALGVVQGYPDGLFRPDQKVTRAELVRIMVGGLRASGSLQGEGTAADLPFVDAAAIPVWVGADVDLSVRHGLITGYEDGTFRASEQVTREQAVVMAVRALQGTVASVDEQAAGFVDSADIAPWAQASVTAGLEAGLVQGFADGTFKPQDVLTRAQAVTLLARAMDW